MSHYQCTANLMLITSLMCSALVYADSVVSLDYQNVFYNDPVVKEATIEWPEPDPDEALYWDFDPAYSDALNNDRPKQTIVNTYKKGHHHFITATLVGRTGNRFNVQFMIDTGASFVAVPQSMMSGLGVSIYQTTRGKVQTANGLTDALFAKIPALEIGNESVKNLTIGFMRDQSLGSVMLLGMNVFRNYQVTLDDKRNTLTLNKE